MWSHFTHSLVRPFAASVQDSRFAASWFCFDERITCLQTSGLGRELGEYALQNYTEVKTVIVSLSKL